MVWQNSFALFIRSSPKQPSLQSNCMAGSSFIKGSRCTSLASIMNTLIATSQELQQYCMFECILSFQMAAGVSGCLVNVVSLHQIKTWFCFAKVVCRYLEIFAQNLCSKIQCLSSSQFKSSMFFFLHYTYVQHPFCHIFAQTNILFNAIHS